MTNDLNQQLLDAVINNQAETVKSLIEQGADPNCYEDEARICPLHFAAVYDCADVVPVLITAGANIHALTEHSDTALSVAKRHENTRTVAALSKFYCSAKDNEQ